MTPMAGMDTLPMAPLESRKSSVSSVYWGGCGQRHTSRNQRAGIFNPRQGDCIPSTAADPIAAGSTAGGHRGLQAGQQRLLHDAGLRGAETAILKLRNLIVHNIGAAVVVLGAVDLLIGCGIVVFRRAVGYKFVVGGWAPTVSVESMAAVNRAMDKSFFIMSSFLGDGR